MTFKLTEFVQKCQDKLAGNLGFEAGNIVQSDGFMKMNQEAMCQFLQNDDLHIEEEALWEAVVKWSDNQSNHHLQTVKSSNSACDQEPTAKRQKIENERNQMSLLRSIAAYIRFGLMDAVYFIEEVQPTGCLSESEMLVITNYFIMRSKDPGYQGVKMVVKKRRSKLICIKRGEFRYGDYDSPKWSYSGRRVDAICINTNQDCSLEGIGVFDCAGSLDVECTVYDGDNDRNENIIFSMEKKGLTLKHRTDTPFELIFERKVKLKRDRWYTVQIRQRNEKGCRSCHVWAETYKVTTDGLTVAFNDAKMSPNGTNRVEGAFPCLYFSL